MEVDIRSVVKQKVTTIKDSAVFGFTMSGTLFVVSHFVALFTENPLFLQLLSFFGLCILFFSILLVSSNVRVLPLFLISLATGISIYAGGLSFYVTLWEGAMQMRALVSMLLVIPVVGWVLKQENYVEDTVIMFRKKLTNSKTFYFLLLFLTQLISFFLLFGSMLVIYQLIEMFFSKQKSEQWQMLKSTAVLRGFALTTIWVVSIPSFAYSVEALKAPLLLATMQGFIVSVILLLVSVAFFYVYERKAKLSLSAEIYEAIDLVAHEHHEKLYKKPLEFAGLFLSLLALTISMNIIFPIGLLTVIPIIVVIWALSVFFIKQRVGVFVTEAKAYLSSGMAAKSQEIGLIMSAGLLIAALHVSGLSEKAMQTIYDLIYSVPGLNFLWVLPLIVLCLGFLGLGPLTVMVLIGSIVQSIHLPYPPELIVLAMTMGSSLSVMLSPIVVPVIALSGMNGLSPLRNSIVYNWKYALTVYLLVEAYLQLRIL